MTRPPHPCAGLPRAARKAFDTIAAGGELEATAGTLELLVKRGLVARFDEKHVLDDRLPPLITTRYSVPIGHHVAWCEHLTHKERLR
ncbi:conserved protein of unknown function [Bradyrhizobium vignae]|uniref:Uncharacterized protein n=1 Tax=Bradyrhizobium vignae TaxID=1549949 RepID=A0A2U3PUJ7_9BRAD|nr:conserved protein of unknown function [Bradyrhizobium vignae]